MSTETEDIRLFRVNCSKAQEQLAWLETQKTGKLENRVMVNTRIKNDWVHTKIEEIKYICGRR